MGQILVCTQEIIDNREKHYIIEHRILDEFCYNISKDIQAFTECRSIYQG